MLQTTDQPQAYQMGFCQADWAAYRHVCNGRKAKGSSLARVPQRIVVGEGHELVNQIRLVQLRNQVAEVLVGGQAGTVGRLAHLCKRCVCVVD